MVPLRQWARRLQLAHQDLRFERAQAPHPREALQRWLAGRRLRRQRLAQLTPSQAALLLRAEHACATAGLAYPREDDGQHAPWHLPMRFATLRVADLPPHPLVDPAMLSDLFGPTSVEPGSACRALIELLSPGGLPPRWHGLPVGTGALAGAPAARVAVCLHLFYPEVWPEVHAALLALPEPFDLFVTLPDFAATPALARIAADHPRIRFLPSPNRGRDVLPWLSALRAGTFDAYLAVCKLHTKRSPHHQDGAAWRNGLLRGLLPGRAPLQDLLARFADDASLGMAGPAAHCITPGQRHHAGTNAGAVRRLGPRVGLENDRLASRPFFSGTMFWFRPAALSALRGGGLAADHFEPEMAQTDGTTAHAMERLVWPLVEQAGYRVGLLDASGSLDDAAPK